MSSCAHHMCVLFEEVHTSHCDLQACRLREFLSDISKCRSTCAGLPAMLRTILLGARNAAVAATAVGAGAGTAAYCAEDKETRGPSFDPEALERGAKALREINKSPYAKQARWAIQPISDFTK